MRRPALGAEGTLERTGLLTPYLAEVLADDVLRSLQPLSRLVRLEEVLRVPEVRLRTFEDLGIAIEVFPFATDIPFLGNWGTPLLFGPGSILVAHTAEEYVDIAELEQAVDKNTQIARACLKAL